MNASKLGTLTSGVLLGGMLAIVCDVAGVSRVNVAIALVMFTFAVLVHDVRAMIRNATGIQMSVLQTVALCTVGPAVSTWLRVVCFMNGHANPRVEVERGTSFIRPVIVKCGRCHRTIRAATQEEAGEYLRERTAEMSENLTRAFGGLADAFKTATPALDDFAATVTPVKNPFEYKHAKRRNDPPPS